MDTPNTPKRQSICLKSPPCIHQVRRRKKSEMQRSRQRLHVLAPIRLFPCDDIDSDDDIFAVDFNYAGKLPNSTSKKRPGSNISSSSQGQNKNKRTKCNFTPDRPGNDLSCANKNNYTPQSSKLLLKHSQKSQSSKLQDVLFENVTLGGQLKNSGNNDADAN